MDVQLIPGSSFKSILDHLVQVLKLSMVLSSMARINGDVVKSWKIYLSHACHIHIRYYVPYDATKLPPQNVIQQV